ncbi:UDP-2,4-diacetamido-2,4,6-trideoxy-beta-L-altropyranose hydrolase [Lutibacter sp. B2]|nr:UDP-2,4-diacetamido-2,4,6-trideoxy-beta-L-altropyranose hydrolase [Lutibacter sp. B2]
MDICIRADGGSQIGMGHVMRTLVLAKELRKKHNVFYACRVDKPITKRYIPGIEQIEKENFKVIQINENKLKENIKYINADCIITDSYDVDEEYFDIVKEKFKISGCLDDEKICDYFNVDFLINQNPYAQDLNYKVNSNTKLMMGCSYTTLREEFRNIQYKQINDKVRTIMVTVGGSDNSNLTEQILQSIKNFKGTIDIVVGPAFKFIDKLRKYENENVNLHFNANMCELMKKCDLAISSCGSTLYELAACKTPTIGIIVAENQTLAADTMDEMGLIKYSTIKDLYKNILHYTYDERKKSSGKMKSLVDDNGCERIIDCLERML